VAASLSIMSRHPGGANFGMCDGSGRFLSNNINSTTCTDSAGNTYSLLQGLGSIDGGELTQLPP